MCLKDSREDRDILKRVLSEYLNIKQNTYFQYESGTRQNSFDAAINMA